MSTVCQTCFRPLPLAQAKIMVDETHFFLELELLGIDETQRVLVDRLIYEIQCRGLYETVATILIRYIMNLPALDMLGKTSFYLVLALGPDKVLDYLAPRLETACQIQNCAGPAPGVATGPFEPGAVSTAPGNAIAELATAALVAALVAPSGSAAARHGMEYARRALGSRARLAGSDSAPHCAAETILGSTGPLDFYTFDPIRHGTADLFLSALWHHHHGDNARKDEALYVLAPVHGFPVLYPDAFHWGAFDLVEMGPLTELGLEILDTPDLLFFNEPFTLEAPFHTVF